MKLSQIISKKLLELALVIKKFTKNCQLFHKYIQRYYVFEYIKSSLCALSIKKIRATVNVFIRMRVTYESVKYTIN
jgi:hypothetical protein